MTLPPDISSTARLASVMLGFCLLFRECHRRHMRLLTRRQQAVAANREAQVRRRAQMVLFGNDNREALGAKKASGHLGFLSIIETSDLSHSVFLNGV